MQDPSSAFHAKYNSLKRTFECRLASLAAAVSSAITRVSGDEVLLQLKASETTVQFAQAHVQSLVDEHLNAERDGCFHDLANKVADAELEASRATLRNEELSSSVRILQEEAKRGERSRVEVAHVKSEIRELRHEYQTKLEQMSEESRQLKNEVADTRHRTAVLVTERDEFATKACSLQEALVDAQARGVEADLKGTGLPRLERELGEERSTSARLKSELTHAQDRLGELAASHQKLKFQVLSLRNDLKERDKRLHLAGANKRKNETKFRAAVARMESLLEEESRDSTAAIKELRDQTLLVKNRLSTRIQELQASNSSLAESLSSAKVELSELGHLVEVAQKDKQSSAAAGAAREEVLRTEVEQARSRADTLSHSLAETIREQSGLVAETANAKAAAEALKAKSRSDEELKRAREVGREQERTQIAENSCTAQTVPLTTWEPSIRGAFGIGMEKILADKLEEASAHVSEMRIMLRQEVQHREAAEAEVGEAQENLKSSQHELVELRNLARKLEQMACSSLAHIDEKNRAIKQLEGKLRSSVAEQEERNASNTLELQSASRRSDCERMRRPDRRRDRALISSANGDGRAGIMAGTSGLRSSLAGIKTQLSEGKRDLEKFVRQCAEEMDLRAERLTHSLQGISSVLSDSLGVALPNILRDDSVAADKHSEGLSDFATALADALAKVEQDTRRVDVTQSLEARPYEVRMNRPQNNATRNSMVWGDRSKDDFNMLAQLQKIEVESELQSLRARLENMTGKYNRAAAARDNVDRAPTQEAREQAKEELARVVRAHKTAMAALEATLSAEKSRCQDLRARVERQAREHQLSLAEANERKLQTQQQLDKVQQALDHAQFALGREAARRARLERKLEDNGIDLPRSISPRGGRSSEGRNRTLQAQKNATQPMLHREPSARSLLGEARAKLRQEKCDTLDSSSLPGCKREEIFTLFENVSDVSSSILAHAPADEEMAERAETG